LAVDERQSLETTTREETIARRKLNQLQEKKSQLSERQEILIEEERVQSEKEEEVKNFALLVMVAFAEQSASVREPDRRAAGQFDQVEAGAG
jgi:hypothetical protein